MKNIVIGLCIILFTYFCTTKVLNRVQTNYNNIIINSLKIERNRAEIDSINEVLDVKIKDIQVISDTIKSQQKQIKNR